MPPKIKPAEDIPLISFEELSKKAGRILRTTKRESDRQLAAFQAANVRKRESRKKR